MKKVLIITYYWPPSGGAGVQRWLKFSKYLPEFGWKPIIYTPENPEAPADDNSLMRDIRAEVEVIKRPIWEPYSFYKKILGLKKTEKINAGFLSESKKNKLLERIATWLRGNLFIPDARKFWIKPSIKYLSKYLINNPVDAIVTTGPPHSMHLIGLGLKKKTNLPWIADFRDPWTQIDFYQDLNLTKWADKKHHYLEKTVLKSADKVIGVSKNNADHISSLGVKNVSVITNGFDEEDFREEVLPDPDCFSIVHIGAMNKDRNHEIFWRGIVQLVDENAFGGINWEIKLIGKYDVSVVEDIQRFDLENKVKLEKYRPHKEIIKLEKKATILYLPINNTPNAEGILTGKLFEYLGAGRPILAIGPTDGELAKILNETGNSKISDFNDRVRFVDNLRKFILLYKNEELKTAHSNKTFTRKNLTGKLADTLNDLCE